MPIENRNLTKGTKLTGRYHKQSYSCEVVENAEGKLHYRLEDGREFKSPSAAGMAITGHACDGWVFWSVQTEETTAKPDAEKQETKAAPAVETNQAKEPAPTGSRQDDPRRPGSFWSPIRRVCRKARFAGSAGTAARVSSLRQSKSPGFAPTIKPTKTI